MEKKEIEEMLKVALAPLADGLKAVESGLETQGKAIKESGEKVEAIVAKAEEGAKAHTDSVKELGDKLEEAVGDTIKRFDRIEAVVTKPNTQKINGQGGDGDKGAKWPSISGAQA